MATLLELSQGYYSAVERGDKNVSKKMLVALKEEYSISSNWLLFGEGSMYLNSDTQRSNPIPEGDEHAGSILQEPLTTDEMTENDRLRARIVDLERTNRHLMEYIEVLKGEKQVTRTAETAPSEEQSPGKEVG